MITLHVSHTRLAPTTVPASPQPPATGIVDKRFAPTFRSPVTEPGGATRRELWAATSADRLWEYTRQDDDGTTWTIRHRPTGQTRPGYGTIREARIATAGPGLLNELRAEAARDAQDPDRQRRAIGQYRLGVHMRLAGADEADARCECGGLLVNVSRQGEVLAHLDACAECWTYGRGFHQPESARTALWACPGDDPHRMCTDPRPVLCGHWAMAGCTRYALPAGGAGCEGAQVGECCRCCVAE